MKTDWFEVFCFGIFIGCLLLMGCAELRSGWVKVDFMEGHPSEYIVCHLITEQGEMTAKCVSMEAVEREMQRRDKRRREGEL